MRTAKTALYLHTKVTSLIFIFAGLAAITQTYFGTQILCFVSNTGIDPKTITTRCVTEQIIYTHDTYLVASRFGFNGIYYGVHHHRVKDVAPKVEHSYLRFTGLVFTVIGILYLMPYVYWNNYADHTMRHLLQLDNSRLKEDQKYKFCVTALINIPNPQKYLNTYTLTLILNVFVSAFYLLGCMFLFQNVRVFWYALEYVGYYINMVKDDPSIHLFPRQARCDLFNFGPSGTPQKFDALCFLPINAYLDKFMLFLTFWLMFVGVLNFVSLIIHFNETCHTICYPNKRINPGHMFLLSMMKMNLKHTTYNKVLEEYRRITKIKVSVWFDFDLIFISLQCAKMYHWLSEIYSYHNSHNQVFFIYIWEAENKAENQSESNYDWFFASIFRFFLKKIICENVSEKLIKIGSNLDFNVFFTSLFSLRKFGKFLNALQFYASGSACFSFFAAMYKRKINQNRKQIWFWLIFRVYFSRFFW